MWSARRASLLTFAFCRLEYKYGFKKEEKRVTLTEYLLYLVYHIEKTKSVKQRSLTRIEIIAWH